MLAGLLVVLFGAGGMILSGGMVLHGLALYGTDLATFGFIWFVANILVGLGEEYTFRGHALRSLWWAVGWHAALDFGQLFLIGTRNGGQTPVGHLFEVIISRTGVAQRWRVGNRGGRLYGAGGHRDALSMCVRFEHGKREQAAIRLPCSRGPRRGLSNTDKLNGGGGHSCEH